jgi:YHS domain-containing protein
MAKDPVCGMNVDEKKAAGTTVYKGKTYYFCSAHCKAQFEKHRRSTPRSKPPSTF